MEEINKNQAGIQTAMFNLARRALEDRPQPRKFVTLMEEEEYKVVDLDEENSYKELQQMESGTQVLCQKTNKKGNIEYSVYQKQ